MVTANPKERPTINDAISDFEDILSKVSPATLCLRAIPRKEYLPVKLFRSAGHSFRQMRFKIQGIPLIPPSKPLVEKSEEEQLQS